MHHPWTRETVCSALVQAYRKPGGAFLATPGEVERTLNWRLRIPGLDPLGWRFLLLWGLAQAGGPSVSLQCRENGWTRTTFERAWRSAADTIATGLSAEGVNAAAELAGEAARRRLGG